MHYSIIDETMENNHADVNKWWLSNNDDISQWLLRSTFSVNTEIGR